MTEFDASRFVEPDNFHVKCRDKGRKWLRDNPKPPRKARPKDLWSKFKPDLRAAFNSLCGYTAIYEPIGTVDHFKSVHEDESLAYEWSNYRYSAQWINSSKNSPIDIIDPLIVKKGWFKIHLPSMLLTIGPTLPDQYAELATYTIERLNLYNDERVLEPRVEWYRMYRDNEITLEGLRKKAPLIAIAIEEAQ